MTVHVMAACNVGYDRRALYLASGKCRFRGIAAYIKIPCAVLCVQQ